MLFPIPKGGSTGSQFKTHKTKQLSWEITDEIKMQVWLINTIWKDTLCFQLNSLQSLLMISTHSPYSHISSAMFLFIWEKVERGGSSGTTAQILRISDTVHSATCSLVKPPCKDLIRQPYGVSLSSQSIFWAPPGLTAWKIACASKWALIYIKYCSGTITLAVSKQP